MKGIRFLKQLNLPNRLTVLRLMLIPLFFFFLLLPEIPGCGGTRAPWRGFLPRCSFSRRAITDHLDGKFARKYG